MTAEGADIEIIDAGSKGVGVVVPNKFVINGREVLLPENADIEIGKLDHKNVATIRVTMFVKSLSVRRENPEYDVPGATGTLLDGVITDGAA